MATSNAATSAHTPAGEVRRRNLWQDTRLSAALAAAIAALSGVIVGQTMPYGPATAQQVLVTMAGCFVVGLAAGLLTRSRWSILLAPLVHMIALEIARIDAIGPTVDAPRFNEMWGIVALVLGRGIYAILALFPIMLGVAYGVWLARRQTQRRPGWLAILSTIVLLALAVAFARPASVPQITGADGKPLPGSIAALEKVKLGGQDQWILLRGQSVDRPVMLYLAGGPGQSDLAWPPVLFRDLEQDMVIVTWDQRGTGKSYVSLDPSSTYTLDRAVSDTIELTEYLSRRFGEQKIYLLGESWGTTLGVLAAQRRPDLYHAFIGSGQMVSQRETDRRLYYELLDLAQHTNDTALAGKLRSYGEPPYQGIWGNAFVMGYYDALGSSYSPPQSYIERSESSGVGPVGMMAPGYTLIERVNVLRGLMDMFAVMYPQIQGVDFRRDVTQLETPVYIFDAEHELAARRDLALEWFSMLQSPRKQLFTMENAGHAAAFEEFETFRRIMVETIIPQTYKQ